MRRESSNKFLIHKLIFIYFGCLILFFSLSGCDKTEREIVHPTDDNIPEINSLVHISKERNDIEDKELLKLGKRLNESTEIISIGESQGQKEKIFGVIERALLHKENLYVLDSRTGNIRVFDLGGAFIRTIGQGGNGPGEFVNAEDMFIDSESMFVLDRYMKIEIFDFRNKIKSFEYDSTLSLKSYALSFCQLNDSTIVVSDFTSTNEYLLSEYDMDGRFKNGMGLMYKSDKASIRTSLSRGIIACSEKHQMILNAFYYFPYVYAYSNKGKLLWTSKIVDFDIQRITEKDQGRTISYTKPLKQPFHTFWGGNLVLVSDNYFLAQIKDYTKEPHRLDTYLISLKDGDGIYINSELPLISSTKDSLLIAIEEEPFPKVNIFSY